MADMLDRKEQEYRPKHIEQPRKRKGDGAASKVEQFADGLGRCIVLRCKIRSIPLNRTASATTMPIPSHGRMPAACRSHDFLHDESRIEEGPRRLM